MYTNAMNNYGAIPKGVQSTTFQQDAQTHLTSFKKDAKALAAAAHKGLDSSEPLAITTTDVLINLIHQSQLSEFTKRFLLQSLVRESAREDKIKKK